MLTTALRVAVNDVELFWEVHFSYFSDMVLELTSVSKQPCSFLSYC